MGSSESTSETQCTHHDVFVFLNCSEHAQSLCDGIVVASLSMKCVLCDDRIFWPHAKASKPSLFWAGNSASILSQHFCQWAAGIYINHHNINSNINNLDLTNEQNSWISLV